MVSSSLQTCPSFLITPNITASLPTVLNHEIAIFVADKLPRGLKIRSLFEIPQKSWETPGETRVSPFSSGHWDESQHFLFRHPPHLIALTMPWANEEVKIPWRLHGDHETHLER